MRDFGFIKEYVKGLGVIGAYVRMCRRGYLLRAIRIRYPDLFVPCPCHSHPFSCYSYSLSGLIRTLSVLFARLSQAVRPANGRAAGDTPEGGYALRSGALGVVLCALLYLLGLVCEYRREYPVSTP
jgi:hypothetical protein